MTAFMGSRLNLYIHGRFVDFGSGRSSTLCEGRLVGRPKTITGEVMTQYLVAVHHPDGYDGSTEDEAMHRDIAALNGEMKAAGVRVFVGGLYPASSAKSVRAQPDGKVLITDGPYLETKEHVGGFWVLEAADLDEALAWGRKAAVACRVPVEVRPFRQRNA
jgi:hypothetical protein